jgi:hypothetical protein
MYSLLHKRKSLLVKIKINILMWLVGICTLFQLIAIVYYIDYFDTYGYLPTPFIYNKFDTFMDFFNVMYWAGDSGRYTDWHSVYPPINFLLLQFVSWIFLGPTNGLGAVKLRELTNDIPAFICIAYLLLPIFVLRSKLFFDFKFWQKTIFYFFVISGTPFLFALERGNLILAVPVFLAIVFDKSKFWRILGVAILINIKPYFVLLLIAPAAERQWREMIESALVAGGIFVASGLILGGDFLSFFANLLGFGQSNSLFSLREVMAFPSSVSAFSYVLRGETFSLGFFEGPMFAQIAAGVEFVKIALLVLSLAVLLMRGRIAQRGEQIAMALFMISNLGVSIGGYSMLFYMLLLPVLIKMRYWKFYIVVVCLLFMPIDVITLLEEPIGSQVPYMSDGSVFVTWTLGLGSIVRPLLNLLMLAILTLELYRRNDKWADLQHNTA